MYILIFIITILARIDFLIMVKLTPTVFLNQNLNNPVLIFYFVETKFITVIAEFQILKRM